MPRKLTTEEFIANAREIHGDKYDYSKVEYKSAKIKVCIVCPIHGEFWQNPYNHLKGIGCPSCSKKKKHHNDSFIKEAKIIHGNKYDYSKVEYKNNHTKVCIICPEHGEFWQAPSKHLSAQGCPKCSIVSISLKKRMDFNDFIELSNKQHGNKYNYSKAIYINCDTPIEIICPIHGSFWQTPYRHLKGHGCHMCSHRSYIYSKNEFIEKSILIHGNKYDYSLVEYLGNKKKVKIICPEHGVFEQIPTVHYVNKCGCPKCSASHGELKVEEYLKNNGIEYKTQYSVKLEQQMFSRNNLKIDFYLPKHNKFIEFNGIQHYEFTPAFHKTKEEFTKQVERDKRLKEYCKENKIKLIVIKYNQIDKIEEILNKKLKIN